MANNNLFRDACKSSNRENEAKKRKTQQEINLRGDGIKIGGNAFKSTEKSSLKSLGTGTPVNPDILIEVPFVFAEDGGNDNSDVQEVLQRIELTLDSNLIATRKKITRELIKQPREEHTEWVKRSLGEEKKWKERRSVLNKEVISSHAFPYGECETCEKSSSFLVKCLTCRSLLCGDCDFKIHQKLVLHNRKIFKDYEVMPIPQNTFINEDGSTKLIDVHIQCLKPRNCIRCRATSSALTAKSGARNLAVITLNGRFDVKSCAYDCIQCKQSFEATIEHYASSGFRPGRADDSCHYLFDSDLLSFWHHLQHMLPSTSQNKVLEVLGEISNDNYRKSIINPTEFSMASKEYEYHLYRIAFDIKLIDNMKCKACGKQPLSCHCDGNMKLYRLKAAKDHGSEELFEGIAIATKEEVDDFIAVVNEAIPQTKGHATCGASIFSCGQTDSSGHYKSLDETGLVVMCCRHGTTFKAANMYRGETYRLVAYMHAFALQMNVMFFCYDVICRYWAFAQKLGRENPSFSDLTKKMQPFLSRFHGKAHEWICQVLWLGHWRKQAAATLGEEMEQGFSKFSRYGCVTKHMSKANRNDHLSKAFLYENAMKEKNMPKTLTKRLNTALKKIPLLSETLNKLMEARKLQVSDLPDIGRGLVSQAKLLKDKRLKFNDWPLTNLQRELEGITLAMKHLQEREMRFADGSIARNAHRRRIGQLKSRATSVITAINNMPETLVPVTEAHRLSGIFPWHDTTGYVSVARDFLLIDTWMLLERFQEEVPQTKKEMCSFVNEINNVISQLKTDVNDLLADENFGSPFTMGTLAMKNEEIRRLSLIFSEAFELFESTDSDFIESLEFTPDDITWEVEEELLNRLVGELDEDGDSNAQTNEGNGHNEDAYVECETPDVESDFFLPLFS